MLMKLFFLIAGVLLSTTVMAAQRIIELTDGSKIKGEVVSMTNDTFTVRTAMLGTIHLKASQIVDMTAPGAMAAKNVLKPEASKQAGDKAEEKSSTIAGIQSNITGNVSLMGDIMRLQSDPRMQAVLADPTLMKAVHDLDFETLSKDPRIQALMNDPAVKNIKSGVH